MNSETKNDGPLNSRWNNDLERWETITQDDERSEALATRAAMAFWAVTISIVVAAALLIFSHHIFTLDKRVNGIRNTPTPEARP